METNNHRHKKKLFFTKDSHNPPITLLENKTDKSNKNSKSNLASSSGNFHSNIYSGYQTQTSLNSNSSFSSFKHIGHTPTAFTNKNINSKEVSEKDVFDKKKSHQSKLLHINKCI